MWNFTINDSISLATKNIKLCVSVNFCLLARTRKHCAKTQTIALPLAGWRGNGRLEIWTMKAQGIPSTWLMSPRSCWKRGRGVLLATSSLFLKETVKYCLPTPVSCCSSKKTKVLMCSLNKDCECVH